VVASPGSSLSYFRSIFLSSPPPPFRPAVPACPVRFNQRLFFWRQLPDFPKRFLVNSLSFRILSGSFLSMTGSEAQFSVRFVAVFSLCCLFLFPQGGRISRLIFPLRVFFLIYSQPGFFGSSRQHRLLQSFPPPVNLAFNRYCYTTMGFSPFPSSSPPAFG